MGNDVMSWRVAIGIFNCKTGYVVKNFRFVSKPFSFIIDDLIYLLMKLQLVSSYLGSYMQPSILNLEFTFVIFSLGWCRNQSWVSTEDKTSSL